MGLLTWLRLSVAAFTSFLSVHGRKDFSDFIFNRLAQSTLIGWRVSSIPHLSSSERKKFIFALYKANLRLHKFLF